MSVARECEDRADFGAEVRRVHDVGDDRDRIGAGGESFHDARLRDSADRHDWNLDCRADRAKLVEAFSGGVVPQSAWIHWSKSDVIGAAIFSGARLLNI